MRIALVHSFYSSRYPSGENSVVQDQAQELRRAGHDVAIVSWNTDSEERKPFFRISAAFRVATGLSHSPTQLLEQFKPDIVHVHNLFPNIGSRWLRTWRGPLVLSLHNYRFACSNGLLYRQGSVCWDCPKMGSQRAVMNACYHNSRAATLPVAVSRSSFTRSISSDFDAVITTSVASDVVVRQLHAGLRTTLIPNFVHDTTAASAVTKMDNHWVALGRMTPEKGLRELVEIWPPGFSLDVIGEGPQENEIRALANSTQVTIRGMLPRRVMRDVLAGYQGLIFPSRWLEVAPQIVVEAMRLGLPVVAFEANSVSTFVENTQTGKSYSDRSSLESVLRVVQSESAYYSSNARNYYEEHWTPSVWLRGIETLYERLIG